MNNDERFEYICGLFESLCDDLATISANINTLVESINSDLEVAYHANVVNARV